MADREAKIRVSVEGTDEAVSSAKKVADAWGDAPQTAGKHWKSFTDSVASSVQGMIQDVGRAGLAIQGLSFAGAIADARQYREAVGRMAVQAGTDASKMKEAFAFLGKKGLVSDEQVASFSKSMGRVIYDVQGAAQAFGSLNEAAIALDRAPEEMIPVGEALTNIFGVSGDASKQLGVMAAQAEKLGTLGGPGVVLDELKDMSGLLSQMSSKSLPQVGALLAGFGGAGINKGQRERGLSSVLGSVGGNMQGWTENFLGGHMTDYLDENGHIKDPAKLVRDIRAKFIKRYGAGAKRKMMMTFGNEGGAELFNTSDAALSGAEGVGPSDTFSKKAAAFAASDVGGQIAAQNAAKQNARNTAEGVLPLFDKLNKVSGEHPFLTMLGMGAGTSILGSLASGGIKMAGKGLFRALAGGAVEAAAGGGGEAAAAGGAAAGGGLLLPLLGILGAGAAGAGIGYGLDQAFGISDAIGETANSKSADAAEFQKDERLRAVRRATKGDYAHPIELDDRTPAEIEADRKRKELAGSLEQRGAGAGLANETAVGVLTAAFSQALAKTKLQVTVQNNTLVPLAATEEEKGKTPKQ